MSTEDKTLSKEKIEKADVYADEIPLWIRKMFSGLDNDTNWAILVILKKFGDCSLSDLERMTKLNKDSLEQHIKKLLDSGLIENYLQKKKGRKEISFYEITLWGTNILDVVERWYWGNNMDND